MNEVRSLTPGDAHAYSALRREMLLDSPWAFASSPEDDVAIDPTRAADRLRDPLNVIVGAFHEGALASAAGVRRSPKIKSRHIASIWGVYASPRVRGQGVGRAVMHAAIDVARGWEGVQIITLSASVRSTRAIALYESLGFVRWGVEPACTLLDGELIDEVHMQLRLDQH